MTQPDLNAPAASTLSVGHYENFPVAGILCPPHIRAAVCALYAWARAADDWADEGQIPPAQRLAALAALRHALPLPPEPSSSRLNLAQNPEMTCPGSEAEQSRFDTQAFDFSSITQPLNAAIERHRLPVQPLHDLLTAFEHDVHASAHTHIYPNHEALLHYCRHSANPVGRLMLHLWGEHSPQAQCESDAICTALQLINFWQDTSVDLQRHRCYLPQAQCQQFGLDACTIAANPSSISTDAAWPLMQHLLHLAEQHMYAGMGLPQRIATNTHVAQRWKHAWQLRLVIQGGLRMVHKVRSQRGANIHTRKKLGFWDWVCVIFQASKMP